MSQLVNHNTLTAGQITMPMTPFTFATMFENKIRLGETVLIDQRGKDVLVRVITQSGRWGKWMNFAQESRQAPGVSIKQRKWDDYNSWEISWYEKGLILRLSKADRAKLAAGAMVIRRSSPVPF